MMFDRIKNWTFFKQQQRGSNLDGSMKRLRDSLPYRAYDPEHKIFHNSGSIGFIMQVAPMIGGDERAVNMIQQMLAQNYPKDSVVEARCFLSPKVATKLNDWFVTRLLSGGIHKEMAKRRVQYLASGAWHSLAGGAPFLIKNFSCAIVVEIPMASADTRLLMSLRDSMKASLASIGVTAIDLEAAELLALVDEMARLSQSPYPRQIRYDVSLPLNEQALPSDLVLRQEMDRLCFRTEAFGQETTNEVLLNKKPSAKHEHFDVRSFRVSGFPENWALWDNSLLIGDMFSEQLNAPCPMVITLAFQVGDQESLKGKATLKHMRKQQQSETLMAKWVPGLKSQADEWRDYLSDVERGASGVDMYYGVTIFSPWGEGDANERTVRSMYKAQNWDLESVPGLQTHGYLAALPMTKGSGLFNDLRRSALTYKTNTAQIANLLPLQGEYLGSNINHMLFLGWRGQPFFWSPMENNDSGNHNLAVIGKSGSGKSFLLQELCSAFVGSGCDVTILDNGRSFANSSILQGARSVEFTASSNFSLNVFRLVDSDLMNDDKDYYTESMGLLKSIFGQMAKSREALNDIESSIIDLALNAVWKEKGASALVDDVIVLLKSHEHSLGKDLGTSLEPYGSNGTYGKFFVGEPSFALNDRFTIFEFSHLQHSEELRSVILTAVMFMARQKMMKTDRRIFKYLVIDEAWQLLQGGSMAEFIETYARTCRKYGGSLITATQSLDDFYKTPASKAAIENSDWSILLQQKPEAVSGLVQSERFSMSPFIEKVVKAVSSKAPYYSSALIRGPDMEAWGRLVVDPYSATIFSSSADDVGRIDQLKADGYDLSSIISHMAYGEPLMKASVGLHTEAATLPANDAADIPTDGMIVADVR
jgi:conjugal transfer ATP-binding protein TraC